MLVEQHQLSGGYSVEVHASTLDVDCGDAVYVTYYSTLSKGGVEVDRSRSYWDLTKAREELGYYASQVRSLG